MSHLRKRTMTRSSWCATNLLVSAPMMAKLAASTLKPVYGPTVELHAYENSAFLNHRLLLDICTSSAVLCDTYSVRLFLMKRARFFAERRKYSLVVAYSRCRDDLTVS